MITGGDPVTSDAGTTPSLPAGHHVTGRHARFTWERALRGGDAPRYLKGFLLLIGTYMSNDGTSAMPSVPTLAREFELSQQRVYELLKEAEMSGWLITRKRPGKPSERLPATPLPVNGQLTLLVTAPPTPQTSLTGGHPPLRRIQRGGNPPTPQTGLRGTPPVDDTLGTHPSDRSETTPQTGLRGTPDPSDRSETTEEITDL